MFSASIKCFREPYWHRRSSVLRSTIAPAMRTWLFDDRSLTARLKAGCKASFHVQVVEQHFARVELNEELALGIPNRQQALLREVYLYCNGQAVVYARSVIPLATLTGRQRRLAYLGDKPLGGFLFSCPSMQRDEVELTTFGPGNLIYEKASKNSARAPEQVWGRRSVFRLSGKPLLVAEIFLPEICHISS
jgi:chorismate--pyruvate lyase